MSNHINYREELAKARNIVKNMPRDGKADTISAYWDVCCGDVLVAEDSIDRTWEITPLAKEFLDIAHYLAGYDHMLDNLNKAVERMANCIANHPSLKLRILQFRLHVLRRIEARCGHDLSVAEDVSHLISFYSRNIDRADRGELDAIEQEGTLRHDPVEWTAAYESNIDQAEQMIAERLGDVPRGMGFCHAYWATKAQVLREEFDIEWRSPSQMNPNVLFD
ncbi:MAG: hypothetical protein ACI4BH_02030 [Muribaculaceae bacterium]